MKVCRCGVLCSVRAAVEMEGGRSIDGLDSTPPLFCYMNFSSPLSSSCRQNSNEVFVEGSVCVLLSLPPSLFSCFLPPHLPPFFIYHSPG